MPAVKFYLSTESEILALDTNSSKWVNLAFYYPNDKDYFYQALNGVMRPIGKNGSLGISTGEGVTINGKVMGGVKTNIKQDELVDVPIDYDYNTFSLSVSGSMLITGGLKLMK